MTQTVTGAVKIYEAGRTYDVSDFQAIRWRKAGICKPVETTEANLQVNATVNGEPIEVEVMAMDNTQAEKAVKKPKRKRQRKPKGE